MYLDKHITRFILFTIAVIGPTLIPTSSFAQRDTANNEDWVNYGPKTTSKYVAIVFKTGSSEIKAHSIKTLSIVADILIEHPAYVLNISAKPVSSEEMKLVSFRIGAIKNYLAIRRGINSSRLKEDVVDAHHYPNIVLLGLRDN